MNTVRIWLSLLFLGLLAACGGGGDSAAAPVPNPPAPPTAATAAVKVTVIDTLGRFVAGAEVIAGAQQANTDASGQATLPVATGSEQLVAVGKAGFAEQVKLITVPAGRSDDALRVMLVERDAAVAIHAIESGGTASGRDGVKVTLPAAALVDAAGAAATGTIQMQMTPLNVVELEAAAFPGAFEGTPTGGARAAIISYGTAELLPLQDGRKLNLAAGKTAQIELPVYANLHQDGSPVVIGDTIALWSLNTATGLWTQEGSGTVVASAASPTGKALRATIAHFSWWNADAASRMGAVNLTVVVPNPNGAVAASTLGALTAQVAGGGPGFLATTSVPVGSAARLLVPSSVTTRLTARVELPTQVCDGSVDVSPAVGTTVDATISAVCVTVPVPTIVNPSDTTATNSSRPVTIEVTIAGPLPDTLDVLVDGTSILPAPLGSSQGLYRVFWDTAAVSEGTHSVVARSTRQGISRDSVDVTVVVDRTPPHATTISPASSAQVSRDTVFTVDFDEPINPLPFTLADAVKFTVVPLGQSTPVVIATTLAYEDTQRRLTVTPTQALPLGVAGLSWGGLFDSVGNAVAGTVAATWSVARVQSLGAFSLFNNSRLTITTNSAGTVFAQRQRAGDGNVEALRFDGAAFVPIGPVINDRTVGGDAFGSIAADANGQVYAAFVQADAAGTAAEVVAKRFDANANAWVTLVAPFPSVGVNVNPSIAPKLALNAAGQPVLVFVDFTPSLVLRGFRFDGTTWVDLGSLSGDFFSGPTAMALDANGNAIVALLDNGALRVVRNTGSAWVAMGAVLDSVPNGTQSVGEPSLAIDGAGQPWVAWSHFPSPPVNLVRFDGTSFVPVPVTPTPTHGHPVLTFINGDPVLTIGDDSTEVRRQRNGVWEPAVPVAVDGRGPIVAQPSNGSLILGVTGNGNGVGTLLQVAFP